MKDATRRIASMLTISIVCAGYFYATGSNISDIEPRERHKLPTIPEDDYSWNNNVSSYSEINSVNEDYEKIEIFHRVTRDLLVNSVDVDPDIVEIVDQEFWNLI